LKGILAAKIANVNADLLLFDKITARNGNGRANFAPRVDFGAAKDCRIFIDGIWQGIDTCAQ